MTNPARVESLRVDPTGVAADLELTWNAVTEDAAGNAETVAEYRICRDPTPCLVADEDTGSNLIGTSAGRSFTDVGVRFFGGAAPPTATQSIPATATPACGGGSEDGGACATGCPGGSCQGCDEFRRQTNRIIFDGNPT